jgi:hypothetical protein
MAIFINEGGMYALKLPLSLKICSKNPFVGGEKWKRVGRAAFVKKYDKFPLCD